MSAITFAEYAAQQEARNDIALAVLGHTLALCEALRKNYLDYSINQHECSFETYHDECRVDYYKEAIAKLRLGISPVDFTIVSGRKYHKIIFVDGGGHRSCHAFVDRKTGSVYKAASWRGPAKGERCNLLIIKEREWALANADWSGNWLYLR